MLKSASALLHGSAGRPPSRHPPGNHGVPSGPQRSRFRAQPREGGAAMGVEGTYGIIRPPPAASCAVPCSTTAGW